MADASRGLDELRARMAAATDALGDSAAGSAGDSAADPAAQARAAAVSLSAVLDLIEAGTGRRDASGGLNPASAELLVADALLTDAAARAALSDGGIPELMRALGLDELARRAAAIDEAGA